MECIENSTLILVVNCARTPPAARDDDPCPTAGAFSRTTTRPAPARRNSRATDSRMTPPPTTTTSAVSVIRPASRCAARLQVHPGLPPTAPHARRLRPLGRLAAVVQAAFRYLSPGPFRPGSLAERRAQRSTGRGP